MAAADGAASPPVAPSRPSDAYEPPSGILVGPDAVQGTAEGDVVEEFLPAFLAEVEELGRGRSRPGLVPVGMVRTADPNSHTTFKHVFNAWILPEVGRRVQGGAAADTLLPVQQAIVVFPPRTAPERHRVLLNGEVVAGAAVRPAYSGSFTVGQPVRLRDMLDLRAFALEGVHMETDGFIWIRHESGRFALYFNFLPNSRFAGQISDADRQQVMRAVRDAIAQEMLQALLQGVFSEDPVVRDAMTSDGWCPTPILLPDVWRQMCAAYGQNDPAEAERLALAAVGPVEMDMMLNSWVAEEPFTTDRRFLERGIERYKRADYISAVSVLLPRIEGLANRVRQKRGVGARNRLSDVFVALEQLASADVRDGYIATRIREEFEALIANFLLVQFHPSDPGADAALGRHAHAHGATGDPQYDQRYALKIILAIDALHFVAR